MEVPVRQQTPIPLPGVPRDRVLQHWRRGGIEHTVALLEPGPIQHAKTGGMKRTRRLLVPLVAARRFLFSGVEIPAQFVEMGRSKRGANLLPERISISGSGIGQVVRDDHPQRPRGQRAEQLRVPLEEHSEIDGDRPREDRKSVV